MSTQRKAKSNAPMTEAQMWRKLGKLQRDINALTEQSAANAAEKRAARAAARTAAAEDQALALYMPVDRRSVPSARRVAGGAVVFSALGVGPKGTPPVTPISADADMDRGFGIPSSRGGVRKEIGRVVFGVAGR